MSCILVPRSSLLSGSLLFGPTFMLGLNADSLSRWLTGVFFPAVVPQVLVEDSRGSIPSCTSL